MVVIPSGAISDLDPGYTSMVNPVNTQTDLGIGPLFGSTGAGALASAAGGIGSLAGIGAAPTATAPQTASTGGTGGGGLAVPGGGDGAPAVSQQEILSAINGINNVYSSLFGAIDKAVLDQRKIIEQGTARNMNQTAGELQNVNQGTNRQFAARGLASSDYRTDALGENQRRADTINQEDIRTRDQQLAALGQSAATERTGFQQDQNSIQQLSSTLDQLDSAQLFSLKQDLDQRLAQLQTTKAGYNTESAFIQGLDKFAPVNRTQESLGVLLSDPSATADMKAKIAQGIIANSGASPEEQDSMWNDFLTQLGIDPGE